MLDKIGLDLSKNHFGICHKTKDAKIFFSYVFFKPKLKRDNFDSFFEKRIERKFGRDNYYYNQICYVYDKESYNEIEVDAKKSEIFIKHLYDFINNISGELIISLEDYVISHKIMQLMHVTESFKYFLTKRKDTNLFLCPNVTWKSILCGGQSFKIKDEADRYGPIKRCMSLYHKDVKNFLDELSVKEDIYKDLVDCYCLLNAIENFDSKLFQMKYQKRIFTFKGE